MDKQETKLPYPWSELEPMDGTFLPLCCEFHIELATKLVTNEVNNAFNCRHTEKSA